MPKNLKTRAFACASSMFVALASALLTPPTVAAEPLKVGFVYVSPIGQAGWTFQHDQGRLAMQRALGTAVRTTVVEAVPEGADAERVMRDLAAQGHRLIFATSFGYLEPALRAAADYPQVKFEHAGGYKTAPNLNTYNARLYEARWLAGWLAGSVSKTGVSGYVAAFALPEVIQGINAYTLGMRAANPRAQVKVLWLDTWFDPARERDAANALANAGADVLTHHSASPAVPQVAEERGLKVIAYQSDMAGVAPNAQLAAVAGDWGGYYTRVARAVAAGSWKPQPVWGGMADGMVQLAALHPSLPAPLRAQVDARRKSLVAGKAAPFAGRIMDQAGSVRQAAGRMDDAAIARMDWFVEGVVGTLPAAKQEPAR